MSLVLKDLEIWTDKKKTGWTSGLLSFGNKFTYVSGSGENTCGKTPILKSIMFALGVSENFRADLVEKCSGVRLRALLGGNDLTFQRSFSEKDSVTVMDNSTKKKKSYEVEKEISAFIFEKLGFPSVSLTGSSGNATQLYFSTLAPLFWKEQIDSWHTIYSDNFGYIKDQRQEATRYLLGLAPLHPFGINTEIKKNKKNVDELTEAIADRNSLIQELKKIFETSDDIDVKSLEAEKSTIKARLVSMENDFSTITDATKDFDAAISSLAYKTNENRNLLSEKTSRIRSLKHVIREVDAEIETLTLNDEAADRFRSINQICANKQCGMFLLSKESYGKSLVYLKDQVKDLESNIQILEKEVSVIEGQIDEDKKSTEELEQQKSESLTKVGVEKLAGSIKLNTKRLVEIETKLQTHEKLKAQRDKLSTLITKREKTHQTIESLEGSVSKSVDAKAQEARGRLSELINEWIETLKAAGLSANATIEPGFKYNFGNEKYTDLDGSLRTRAVLAFHAALFEYGLESDVNHPRILILDTPKQQELKASDLDGYMKKLRALCNQHTDAQVIFSSSEFKFKPTDKDKIWVPNYPGDKHPMYLGVAGSELNKTP